MLSSLTGHRPSHVGSDEFQGPIERRLVERHEMSLRTKLYFASVRNTERRDPWQRTSHINTKHQPPTTDAARAFVQTPFHFEAHVVIPRTLRNFGRKL
jgi:hypothetical protein